jgi:uncharacterized membrane protein
VRTISDKQNPTSKLLEAGAARGLAACWLIPLFFNSTLPNTIPTHFDAAGHPNGYSSRAGIWGLPVVVTFVYIILTAVNKISPTALI